MSQGLGHLSWASKKGDKGHFLWAARRLAVIDASVYVVRAFIKLREMIANRSLYEKYGLYKVQTTAGRMMAMRCGEEHRKAVCGKTACTVLMRGGWPRQSW
jgi:hypothetical protein